MNNLKISILVSMLVLMIASCADEDAKPIITFDDAGKGAYPRLISESARDINLFDIGGSAYTYTIEFVDLEQGALVSNYELQYTFVDANPDLGGDQSAGPNTLKSWSASDFETNADGFKGLSNISVSANELLSAAGVSADNLGPGDVFRIAGVVTTTDGQTFTAANSSASVRGAAFRGHFDWNMAGSCPTALDGTYDVLTTAAWCADPAVPANSQVTFTLQADGYDISDFSFGAYAACGSSNFPLGNLRMVDVCNSISITGASQWSEIYTWSKFEINGDVLTIEWTNDYGEGGTSEITRPGGWPPLELN